MKTYLKNITNEGLIKRAIQDLALDSMRFTNTYPPSPTAKGQRGDYSFSSDGSVLAIHNGTQWRFITTHSVLPLSFSLVGFATRRTLDMSSVVNIGDVADVLCTLINDLSLT